MTLGVEWNGDKLTTMKNLGLAMLRVSGHVWQKSSRSIENRYSIIIY